MTAACTEWEDACGHRALLSMTPRGDTEIRLPDGVLHLPPADLAGFAGALFEAAGKNRPVLTDPSDMPPGGAR